jgi:hypothetical protein
VALQAVEIGPTSSSNAQRTGGHAVTAEKHCFKVELPCQKRDQFFPNVTDM